jgi:hypothetical protein
MIDKMMKRTGWSEDGYSSVDQYVTASQIMEHLFNVGLQIEDIDNPIRKQTLVNQLNILLHSYNLPQLELIVTEKDVKENPEDDKT